MQRTIKIDFYQDQRLADVATSIASACAKLGGAVKSAWSTTIGNGAGKYRPEAYYMRGPGPKWRAKNAISIHSLGHKRTG
jgi:hypothetical protein